jgi:hypothetical protein
MKDIISWLKSLKVEIFESFLEYFIWILDSKYGILSCGPHKDNWLVNKLLTICVQKDERIHKMLTWLLMLRKRPIKAIIPNI